MYWTLQLRGLVCGSEVEGLFRMDEIARKLRSTYNYLDMYSCNKTGGLDS